MFSKSHVSGGGGDDDDDDDILCVKCLLIWRISIFGGAFEYYYTMTPKEKTL